jgi:hypothetical protein
MLLQTVVVRRVLYQRGRTGTFVADISC